MAIFTNHYSIPLSDINKLFYYTACKVSFLVNGLLVTSHVGSIIEFIVYGNEVLDDSDHSMPYINAAFSGSAIAVILAVANAAYIYKARRLQCNKIKLNQPE